MTAYEYNFDGLIGPTHNFSGLAYGNIASQKNRHAVSKPKAAALQGLEKIRRLHDLGIRQGIIPPQDRPNFTLLKQHGYKGAERDIFKKVSQKNPVLFHRSLSASAMWTANAATVSPSSDTNDRLVHFTPANLVSQKHRSMEALDSASILKKIFYDQTIFFHHEPLAANADFADEGAANHMRLCTQAGQHGLEIFVYGRNGDLKPQKFPARQTKAACQAHIKNHALKAQNVFCIQQNPVVVDAGVFHNDVIAVSNDNVLLLHECAYKDQSQFLHTIQKEFTATQKQPLHVLEIKENQLSVADAVDSYLFNSQIVTLEDKSMALIAPRQCEENSKIKDLIDAVLVGDHPVSSVHFFDLTESMKNGGGPACLRLRVVLTDLELAGVDESFLLNDQKLTDLENWVNDNYREQIHIDDLQDYTLVTESRQALDRLTQILNCGSIYAFQK